MSKIECHIKSHITILIKLFIAPIMTESAKLLMDFIDSSNGEKLFNGKVSKFFKP